MTKQGEHFIAWNNLGHECQRLNFMSLHRIRNNIKTVGRGYFTDYSFYHMSKYSHKRDSMFFLTLFNEYFVMPNFKHMTYRAKLPGKHYYDLVSAHFMNDSSKVWLLGGTKVNIDIQKETTDVLRTFWSHYETRILNLQ